MLQINRCRPLDSGCTFGRLPEACSSAFMVLSFVAQLLPQPALIETNTFPLEEVQNVLPLPPAEYPEELQGMIWMDQTGSVAHSDIPLGAPDLACSFGDAAFSKWDPKTRTINIDVTGPAWQWMNRLDGYAFVRVLRTIGFHYRFYFSEDLSWTQIYPSVDLGWAGIWSLPKELMSFTMVKMPTPPEGACPPAPNAGRDAWTQCATWDRVSSGLLSPLLGAHGVMHYYVFQVVDKDGNPRQPYFDAYVKHGKHSAAYSEKWAEKFGINVTNEGDGFVATRQDKSAEHSDASMRLRAYGDQSVYDEFTARFLT